MKNTSSKESKRKLVPFLGTLAAILLAIAVTLSSCDFQPDTIFDSAKSGDTSLPFLTKSEIASMLRQTSSRNLPAEPMQIQPDYNPSGSGTWNPGKVKQAALQLALDRLNMLRRFCGLPPVIMTDEGNESAQYGAALMAITQQFGHGGQKQPAGVDDASYKKGINATTYGNVYQLGPSQLVDAVDGYCRDQGSFPPGHRLTLLAPSQQQVGIGTAPAPTPTPAPAERQWPGNIMQVYSLPPLPEGHVAKSFDWDFVSFPSPGYFPLVGSFFGSPATWHVRLNTAKYSNADKTSVRIKLTRTNDGKTWEFYAPETGVSIPVGQCSIGGDTLVFRILETDAAGKLRDHSYQTGEVYQVVITGLKDKSGSPVDFAFKTEFFTP